MLRLHFGLQGPLRTRVAGLQLTYTRRRAPQLASQASSRRDMPCRPGSVCAGAYLRHRQPVLSLTLHNTALHKMQYVSGCEASGRTGSRQVRGSLPSQLLTAFVRQDGPAMTTSGAGTCGAAGIPQSRSACWKVAFSMPLQAALARASATASADTCGHSIRRSPCPLCRLQCK
jgi:hypothetical protein